MVQIVEMNREEKLAMYMKLSKKELANMLIIANELLSNSISMLTPPVQTFSNYPPFCQHDMQWVQNSATGGGFWQCRKCGHSSQNQYEITFTPYSAFQNQ
jgi:hypothetical protein